jgi:hypothetical protein
MTSFTVIYDAGYRVLPIAVAVYVLKAETERVYPKKGGHSSSVLDSLPSIASIVNMFYTGDALKPSFLFLQHFEPNNSKQ